MVSITGEETKRHSNRRNRSVYSYLCTHTCSPVVAILMYCSNFIIQVLLRQCSAWRSSKHFLVRKLWHICSCYVGCSKVYNTNVHTQMVDSCHLAGFGGYDGRCTSLAPTRYCIVYWINVRHYWHVSCYCGATKDYCSDWGTRGFFFSPTLIALRGLPLMAAQVLYIYLTSQIE